MWEQYFSDWDFILSLLPSDWTKQVHHLGMLKGGHKFSGTDGESKLLRTLLIHLAGGLSLRETSAYCQASNLVDVSDVAILKRLRKSEAFFNWCISNLKQNNQAPLIGNLNCRVFDATMIKEPGPTGTLWRFHYSINLKTLMCDEQKLTDYKTGEGFKNYTLHASDVILADRGYSRPINIAKANEFGAFVLIRFTPTTLPLFSGEGNTAFSLMRHLRELRYGDIGDWPVKIKISKDKKISARLIGIRLPPSQIEKQKKAARRASSSHGDKIQAKTLELAEYLMIITTLPKEYSAEQILKLYRLRWQIELVFKRLKSLLGAGHLPKYDDQSSRAWLAGKIFVALLIERIIQLGDDFFPWGQKPAIT